MLHTCIIYKRTAHDEALSLYEPMDSLNAELHQEIGTIYQIVDQIVNNITRETKSNEVHKKCIYCLPNCNKIHEGDRKQQHFISLGNLHNKGKKQRQIGHCLVKPLNWMDTASDYFQFLAGDILLIYTYTGQDAIMAQCQFNTRS